MRRLQPWVVLGLLGVCSLILASRSVLACSPLPPDPWFLTHLEIDGSELPPEILLYEEEPFAVVIQNESGSPVRIEVPGAWGPPRIVVEPGRRQAVNWAAGASGFTARDDRPGGIQSPPPDRFELRVHHGETALSVPIAIHYELNPNYRPGVGASGVAGCSEFYEKAAGLVGPQRSVWLGDFSPRRALIAAGALVAAILVVAVLERLSR